MDPLSITAGVVGLIEPTYKTYVYIRTVCKTTQDKNALTETCRALQGDLERLGELLKPAKVKQDLSHLLAQTPALRDAASRMLSLGEQLKKFVATHDQSNLQTTASAKLKKFGKKVVWPMNKPEALELLKLLRQNVHDIRKRLSFELAIDTKYDLADLKAGLQSLQDERTEDYLVSMLNWIAHVPLHAPEQLGSGLSSAQQLALTDDCSYNEWSKGADWQLCYSGEPGTGKTFKALAAYNDLIDKHQEQGYFVLSLFFKSSQQEHQSPTDVKRNILRQLVMLDPIGPLNKRLTEAWRQARRNREPQITSKVIEEILYSEDGLDACPPSFLIVDAIDESGDSECQEEIREVLGNLNKEHSVSVLTTSRHYPSREGFQRNCDTCPAQIKGVYWACEDCLPTPGTFDVCYECYTMHNMRCSCSGSGEMDPPHAVYVDVVPDENDIKIYCETYINGALLRIGHAGDMPNERMAHANKFVRFKRNLDSTHPKIFQDLPALISKRANGKYLFAKVYTEYLKTQVDAQDFLDAVNELHSSSQGGAESMKNMYKKMISQCIHSDRGKDAELARIIFSLVSRVKCVVSFEALSVAISVCRGRSPTNTGALLTTDQQSVTEWTHGMVVIDDLGPTGRRRVRFFHQTLAEYLATETDALLPEANNRMLEICLTHLEIPGVFDVNQEAWSSEHIERSVRDYPFLWYATRFWGEHARDASTNKTLGLDSTRRICKLLTGCRLDRVMQVAWIPNATAVSDWDVNGGVSALHVCAFFNLSWLASHLIVHHGADPNVKEQTYSQTPLFYACRSAAVETAQALLDAGAEVNVFSRRGRTPLLETICRTVTSSDAATSSAQLQILEMLLGVKGIDLNRSARGFLGRRPVISACVYKHPKILKRLLDQPNVDVNAFDGGGVTAITRAVEAGSLPCVKLLSTFRIAIRSRSLRVNLRGPGSMNTALEAALGSGDRPFWKSRPNEMLAICQILLDLGAEITDRFIVEIIEHGLHNLLQLVLKSGRLRSPWLMADDQRSLLHLAAETCRSETVRAVYEHCKNEVGFNVCQQDRYKSTALHLACLRCDSNSLGILEQLLEYRASQGRASEAKIDARGLTELQVLNLNPQLNARDLTAAQDSFRKVMYVGPSTFMDARPPLWLLIKCHMEQEVLDAIILADDCTNMEPDAYRGHTILHEATLERSTELVRKICASQLADINSQNTYGRTALHLAILNGCETTLETLLSFDADIEAADAWGVRPFELSTRQKRWAMAVKLLRKGAKLPCVENLSVDILHAAISARDMSTVTQLVGIGIDIFVRDSEHKRTPVEHARYMADKIFEVEVWRIWTNMNERRGRSLEQVKKAVDEDPRTVTARKILALLQEEEAAVRQSPPASLSIDDAVVEKALALATSFSYSREAQKGVQQISSGWSRSLTLTETLDGPEASSILSNHEDGHSVQYQKLCSNEPPTQRPAKQAGWRGFADPVTPVLTRETRATTDDSSAVMALHFWQGWSP